MSRSQNETHVSLYIRHHGTRKYEKENPRTVYPEGTIFVLRYELNGKRYCQTLPDCKTALDAHYAMLQKKVELADIARGAIAPPAPKHAPAPKPQLSKIDSALMLDAAIDRYLANVATKSSKTSQGYRYTLQQFYASSGNLAISQVTKQHLYDFVGLLRKEGLGDRTVHNRVGEVVTFLRHFNIKDVTIRIKFVEKMVRAYRPDELQALFAVADQDEWILYQFFLCSGGERARVYEC